MAKQNGRAKMPGMFEVVASEISDADWAEFEAEANKMQNLDWLRELRGVLAKYDCAAVVAVKFRSGYIQQAAGFQVCDCDSVRS